MKCADRYLSYRRSMKSAHRRFLSRMQYIIASETHRTHLAILAVCGYDLAKANSASSARQPLATNSKLRRLVLVEKLNSSLPSLPAHADHALAVAGAKYPRIVSKLSKFANTVVDFLRQSCYLALSEIYYMLFLSHCLIGFCSITVFYATLCVILSISESAWNCVVEHQLFG